MITRMAQLSEVAPGKEITGFDEQFNVCVRACIRACVCGEAIIVLPMHIFYRSCIQSA